MTTPITKLLKHTKKLVLIYILVSITILALIPIMPTQSQETFIPFGLSGYPRSESTLQDIIDVMIEYGMNTYRMSSNPEWFSSKPNPFNMDYIDYYIDNTPSNFILIVDANHLYPPTSASAADLRTYKSTANETIFTVLADYGNNSRVWIEPFNEYVDSDYLTQLQWFTDSIRNAGYTNTIVNNKWNTAWSSSVIEDDDPEQWSGYHFYFNSWSVSGALTQMNYALARDIGGVCNTEVGADYREAAYFTTSTVGELNDFLEACYEEGVGNTIWMCYGLQNWDTYIDLGLDLSFIEVSDASPIYSNIGYNTTVAGDPCEFSCKWTDDVQLSGYIFSTNNTGTWTNDTIASMSGTTSWSNVTKTLNATGGTYVQFKWYCVDSATNWVLTSTQTILTQASDNIPVSSSPTAYPTYAGEDCNFTVTWSDIEGLSGYIFSTNNTGAWTNATWTDIGDGDPLEADATVEQTLNSTVGYVIAWRMYCNDTDNNWGDTNNQFFTAIEFVTEEEQEEDEGTRFFNTSALNLYNEANSYAGYPYIIDCNGTITALTYNHPYRLSYTVNASSGNITITTISGITTTPKRVSGATYIYESTTDTYEFTSEHESETEVYIYFEQVGDYTWYWDSEVSFGLSNYSTQISFADNIYLDSFTFINGQSIYFDRVLLDSEVDLAIISTQTSNMTILYMAPTQITYTVTGAGTQTIDIEQEPVSVSLNGVAMIEGMGWSVDDTEITITGATSSATIMYSAGTPTIPIPSTRKSFTTETWYFRSDTWTVNTELGYKLYTEQSDSSTYVESTSTSLEDYNIGIMVYSIDEDGTSTPLTNNLIAITTQTGATSGTLLNSTGALTENVDDLNLNDAVKVVVYHKIGSDAWTAKASFMTDILETSEFNTNNWSVYYYVTVTESAGTYYYRFYYGETATDSKILNVQYAILDPWGRSLHLLGEGDLLGFILNPYTYYLTQELFYGILVMLVVVPAYNRYRDIRPVMVLFMLFGGVGGFLTVLIPAIALKISFLFLALGIAIMLYKLIR